MIVYKDHFGNKYWRTPLLIASVVKWAARFPNTGVSDKAWVLGGWMSGGSVAALNIRFVCFVYQEMSNTTTAFATSLATKNNHGTG